MNKMTTANEINEIAKKVVDQYQYRRQTPVGTAQKQVLDALGITIKVNGGSHANAIFDALGLVVTSRREGKTSIPVVAEKQYRAGSYAGSSIDENYDGSLDGAKIDTAALRQWMS
jgi:hypothetical protein